MMTESYKATEILNRKLVLFFDTFIINEAWGQHNSKRHDYPFFVLSKIRDRYPAFSWQTKIEVVKFTLTSYAEVEWDEVHIRFECEDRSQESSFENFVRELFPKATVNNTRSDSAHKYYDALCSIKSSDDSWVFFAPNNDHPFIGNPQDLRFFLNLLEKRLVNYPEMELALLYSHFTESMNDGKLTESLWGYYSGNFKRVIEEDEYLRLSWSPKCPLDSTQVFRLGMLKEIFRSSVNKGRVIRIEDTEFYHQKGHNLIQAAPRRELCRHFDSYTNVMHAVPPLFVPDRFFENEVRVRVGFQDWRSGFINLDPSQKWPSESCDYPLSPEDLPPFLQKRVVSVEYNDTRAHNDSGRRELIQSLHDPWFRRSFVTNVIISMARFVSYFAMKGFKDTFRPIVTLLRS